jgi:hypothetical protein
MPVVRAGHLRRFAMYDDPDPWPTDAEIEDYHRDMAARPEEKPTPAEVEAMVEEWLKYHEAHERVIDEYHAAVRLRTGTTPPF